MGRSVRTLLRRLGGAVQINQRKLHSEIPSLKIGLLGVPFCKGQTGDGVQNGPEAIRNCGLLRDLMELGHNVRDFGEVEYIKQKDDGLVHSNLKGLAEVAACNREVSRKVLQVLGSECRVLVLGGDHSVVVGSVDGHIRYRDDISVIYVDAHADLNTADTSPSGNAHGMTVALLVKELNDYWPYLPGMDWQKPTLSVDNIVYIGLRSVDKFERLLLDKFSITAYGMRDVEKYGIDKITEMALDKVDPLANRSLHVSFDIDSLDPLEAPSTGVPERGGLTLREGVQLMELIYSTGRMNVMDLVEVNPSIGSQEDVTKTVQASIQLIKAAHGFSRLGNIPRNVTDIPGHYSSYVETENKN